MLLRPPLSYAYNTRRCLCRGCRRRPVLVLRSRCSDFFLTTYSNTGASLRPSPIVVVEDDYLVLHYNGQRILEPADSMVFHNLKMVSHVPLAVFMTLLTDLYGTPANSSVALSPATLTTLKTYVGFVEAAYGDLQANPGRFTPGAQYNNQVPHAPTPPRPHTHTHTHTHAHLLCACLSAHRCPAGANLQRVPHLLQRRAVDRPVLTVPTGKLHVLPPTPNHRRPERGRC